MPMSEKKEFNAHDRGVLLQLVQLCRRGSGGHQPRWPIRPT